jgi:hypothetical protein
MTDIDETHGWQCRCPLCQAELDEYDRMCRASVARAVPKREAKWRDRGNVFAWIERAPSWCMTRWQWESAFGEPKAPCRRIFRLCVAGGGQIRIREVYVQNTWNGRSVAESPTISYDDPRLSVTYDENGIVHRAGGMVKTTRCYEADQSAVVLARGARQALADRVAATLRAPQDNEDWRALLDGSTGCAICRHPLRDEVSKLLNIGPDCARKFGIPHNLLVASAALQRRRELLAKAESDL